MLNMHTPIKVLSSIEVYLKTGDFSQQCSGKIANWEIKIKMRRGGWLTEEEKRGSESFQLHRMKRFNQYPGKLEHLWKETMHREYYPMYSHSRYEYIFFQDIREEIDILMMIKSICYRSVRVWYALNYEMQCCARIVSYW